MQMRNFSFKLPDELVDKIDDMRGLAPRALFVRKILIEYAEKNWKSIEE